MNCNKAVNTLHCAAWLTSVLIVSLSLISSPALSNGCIDTDGDGWGWNGVASCQATASNNTAAASTPNNGTSACIDPDGDGWGWNGTASCRSDAQGGTTSNSTNTSGPAAGECVDTVGNGWGWNGVASCRTNTQNNATLNSANTPSQTAGECINPDGNGWGWNGVSSCKVAINSPVNSGGGAGSAVPENCRKLESGNYHITELVTDVFLTAGQSNAAGGNTRYQPNQFQEDRKNNRVIVWTKNNRWEVADPQNQTWHNDQYPSGKTRVYNHPAFQIGRAIANSDECRVIAFIATAASGQPINYWLQNQDNHYRYISNKVTNALNALPSRHQVDMIWWMQGEADDDRVLSRYFSRLNTLINKFRSESWYSYNGYFLANETGWHLLANQAIRMLRNDNNNFTDYSRGEDRPQDPFTHIASDPIKVHFNEVALRKIGNLVAYKYLNEYLSGR